MNAMDEIVRLVRSYLISSGLVDQLRFGEAIYHACEPDLSLFIHGQIQSAASEDILQETMIAIIASLSKFKGRSDKEFWAWCYRIARNKISDHWRKNRSSQMQSLPHDEMNSLIEASGQAGVVSPADRLDLEYAMNLLIKSKPDCYDNLWRHFIFDLDFDDIAAQDEVNYDTVRMRITRCLETARNLVATHAT